MINAICGAICTALRTEFGEACRIHTEATEQGSERPCFFVSCTSSSRRPVMHRRWYAEHTFCIRYLPTDQKPLATCGDTLERLYVCLEQVTADGVQLMGTKMRSEQTDDALQFYVNFDTYLVQPGEETPMDGMDRSLRVEGER